MWNETQIQKHIETAKILDKIKEDVFEYLSSSEEGVSESDVRDFILKRFEENNICSDRDPPIVAFRESSAIPHYFVSGKGKMLTKESLILIDLWANIKSSNFPFADITWMAYYGDSIPKEMQKVFDVVVKARDAALNFIQSQIKEGKLPIGRDVDKVSREIINKAGFEGKFIHGTGHSIGTSSPHGDYGHLNIKEGDKKILINLGYTIEPGVYFTDKFGIRSEIDFYVNDKMELIVTTPMQDKLIFL